MSDYKKLILILRKEKLHYAFKRFVHIKLQIDSSSIEHQIVRTMLNNKDDFSSVIQYTFGYSPDTILRYILNAINVLDYYRQQRIIELFNNF